MYFQQVEKQFKKLKAEFEAGTLTEASFKAQLEKLMVKDEEGRWWMIGYETEKWYRHDGTKWVQSALPSKYSPKTGSIPKWISVFWIILGWSISWAIGTAVFGAMDQNSDAVLPLVMGGAISGAIGGFVTGMVLWNENTISNWINVLWITLAWMIGSAIGWPYATLFNLTIGGLVTVVILKAEDILSDLESMVLITLAWAIGSAVGGAINKALAAEGFNQIGRAFIGGAIGAAIGGFFLIWQIRSEKSKRRVN